MKTMVDCPKLFYHKYIAKDIKRDDEYSPFADVGSAVHKVLEVWRQEPHLTKQQLIKILVGEMNLPKEFEWLEKQAMRMVWKIQPNQIFLGDLVRCELEFREVINGIDVVGVIDKIERVGDTLVITDYKTNKAMEPEKYIHQLALYDMVLEKLYPEFKRRHELLYIRHGQSVPFEFTREHYENTVRVTEKFYNYVVDNSNNPAEFKKRKTKDGPCMYCPLKSACWA
jgi:CRISPR/Cas system-associated exonuclease Cas4 (RecB family)